ncbi:hypothetical protein CRE_29720 [Caenorhabditis remanei]|uniref:Uncharacterized protein n=1 Tax=Caenorhabditis remanei TaxID=31234 RepID=E3LVD5_CAERE|nr:hypothetical protein CRE_29720 [Caenorhabditis remanei]
MFERKRAGVDLSNTSVRVCGLRAKYWIIYFIIIQLILGVSNILFFIISILHNKGTDTSSGILNLFCVLLLLCSLWCQSKTMFTIIAVFTVIDTCAEFYLLFTRILIVLEVSSPYYTDYLILVVFSIIRVGFSSIYSVVLMRLSWCNGLADEDDLEKNKIYECIQEMGIYKCTKCSESEDCDEEENEKID